MASSLFDALGHLGRGFIGECDGQDGVGGNALFLDEIGDAVGDDARLARPRAGEDEQGALVVSTAARCSGFSLARREFTAVRLILDESG